MTGVGQRVTTVFDAKTVLHVLNALHEADVLAWLDGGWGVDALLGVQTRPHDDLDLVVALDAAGAARRALEPLGFTLLTDELPTRFVVADDHDHRVDLHTVVFGDGGSGIQTLHDGTPWRYPSEGFAGRGLVLGADVACLTPDVQVLAHLGYEPDDSDRQDMTALAERFGLVLPAHLQR
jgi:lincosamide nucleotidyltransferase A/C/D/E